MMRPPQTVHIGTTVCFCCLCLRWYYVLERSVLQWSAVTVYVLYIEDPVYWKLCPPPFCHWHSLRFQCISQWGDSTCVYSIGRSSRFLLLSSVYLEHSRITIMCCLLRIIDSGSSYSLSAHVSSFDVLLPSPYSPLMIIVQKISLSAFAVHDG